MIAVRRSARLILLALALVACTRERDDVTRANALTVLGSPLSDVTNVALGMSDSALQKNRPNAVRLEYGGFAESVNGNTVYFSFASFRAIAGDEGELTRVSVVRTFGTDPAAIEAWRTQIGELVTRFGEPTACNTYRQGPFISIESVWKFSELRVRLLYVPGYTEQGRSNHTSPPRFSVGVDAGADRASDTKHSEPIERCAAPA